MQILNAKCSLIYQKHIWSSIHPLLTTNLPKLNFHFFISPNCYFLFILLLFCLKDEHVQYAKLIIPNCYVFGLLWLSLISFKYIYLIIYDSPAVWSIWHICIYIITIDYVHMIQNLNDLKIQENFDEKMTSKKS